MPLITDKISSVRHYACGYCVNQLAIVYRGHKFERRIFPSGVFLIKHATKGYVLFDTGYSMSIYNCGPLGRLYGLLNPTFVAPADEIASQLLADGINPDEIGLVVLSHLHPDHIGGVKFFPKAKLVISAGSYATLTNAATSDLVFRRLLPDWFEANLLVLSDQQLQSSGDAGLSGFDLFGDGSLLLTALSGHTRGQIGAYLPGQLLLAADACWGEDLLEPSRKMRLITKLINHDPPLFQRTIDQLTALRASGIRLCFSHDTYAERELLP